MSFTRGHVTALLALVLLACIPAAAQRLRRAADEPGRGRPELDGLQADAATLEAMVEALEALGMGGG